MTIDHLAWVLCPGYSLEPLAICLHTIGRITCPIMCYFIAEGFYHTKNIKKYTKRLFIFSLVSHFAYVLFSPNFVDWKSFIPFYYGDFLNQLQKTDAPVFLLLNKIDRIEKQEVLGLIAQWQSRMEFAEIFPLSAYKGDNVEALVETTFKYLEEGPQFYPADSVTDQPEEVVIAELIREQILQSTRDEVPHSIAVIVEQMKLQDDGKIYVGATIYVERDSQKGIIIGKAGTMLRKIGSRARREIEFLLGEKVYLDLWVKVNEDWRNKETAIKSLYLEDDDDEF